MDEPDLGRIRLTWIAGSVSVAAGTFKTLAAALGAADLVSTLKGAGPTAGGVKVGTATGKASVTKTDIKTSNGVIHVIDSVIFP